MKSNSQVSGQHYGIQRYEPGSWGLSSDLGQSPGCGQIKAITSFVSWGTKRGVCAQFSRGFVCVCVYVFSASNQAEQEQNKLDDLCHITCSTPLLDDYRQSLGARLLPGSCGWHSSRAGISPSQFFFSLEKDGWRPWQLWTFNQTETPNWEFAGGLISFYLQLCIGDPEGFPSQLSHANVWL